MALISFLAQRRRAAADLKRSDGPAIIWVLPLVHNALVVAGVAAGMRAKNTGIEAEDTLASHLETEIRRLMWLGLDQAGIELECREFARAAWVASGRDTNYRVVAS